MPFLIALVLAIVGIIVLIPTMIIDILKLIDKWKHRKDE